MGRIALKHHSTKRAVEIHRVTCNLTKVIQIWNLDPGSLGPKLRLRESTVSSKRASALRKGERLHLASSTSKQRQKSSFCEGHRNKMLNLGHHESWHCTVLSTRENHRKLKKQFSLYTKMSHLAFKNGLEQ